MNQQFINIFMLTQFTMKCVVIELHKDIKLDKSKAITFILFWFKKNLEFGFIQEILMLTFQSLELLPGWKDWEKIITFQLKFHGENGGWRVSMHMKIKLEVWFGLWEDLLLPQLEELDIWCLKIKKNLPMFLSIRF